MRKVIYLGLCILLLGACTVTQPEETLDTTPEPVEEPTDPYLGWETFEDPELGIRFMYPPGTSPSVSQEAVVDLGVRRNISFGDSYIQFTSEDYAASVQEGCCFFFSGPPFDLNRSMEEIAEDLGRELQYVYNLEETTLGAENKPALKFDRINAYVNYWAVPTILAPYEHEQFSNLLISGPTLFETQTNSSTEFLEIESLVSNQNEDQKNLENFWLTVDSLEFL